MDNIPCENRPFKTTAVAANKNSCNCKTRGAAGSGKEGLKAHAWESQQSGARAAPLPFSWCPAWSGRTQKPQWLLVALHTTGHLPRGPAAGRGHCAAGGPSPWGPGGAAFLLDLFPRDGLRNDLSHNVAGDWGLLCGEHSGSDGLGGTGRGPEQWASEWDPRRRFPGSAQE